jgi:hypothetical protein
MAKLKTEEKIDPIFSFPSLKAQLAKMGIVVGQAKGYRPIKAVDVDINDIKQNIEFRDGGIYLKSEDGNGQRIFLYKRNYRLTRFGKPRFHITDCRTIREFMASGSLQAQYRRANTETVPVCDMDNDYEDVMVSDLPLCMNCLSETDAYRNMTTSDFVEILKAAEEASPAHDTEVDFYGYTKDWEQISAAYRELHHYTCEECGIQITNPFDYYYMHTHHLNGNKADNRSDNLKCLCISCHSKVDANHRNNFSRGANRVILEEFRKKYLNQSSDDE